MVDSSTPARMRRFHHRIGSYPKKTRKALDLGLANRRHFSLSRKWFGARTRGARERKSKRISQMKEPGEEYTLPLWKLSIGPRQLKILRLFPSYSYCNSCYITGRRLPLEYWFAAFKLTCLLAKKATQFPYSFIAIENQITNYSDSFYWEGYLGAKNGSYKVTIVVICKKFVRSCLWFVVKYSTEQPGNMNQDKELEQSSTLAKETLKSKDPEQSSTLVKETLKSSYKEPEQSSTLVKETFKSRAMTNENEISPSWTKKERKIKIVTDTNTLLTLGAKEVSSHLKGIPLYGFVFRDPMELSKIRTKLLNYDVQYILKYVLILCDDIWLCSTHTPSFSYHKIDETDQNHRFTTRTFCYAACPMKTFSNCLSLNFHPMNEASVQHIPREIWAIVANTSHFNVKYIKVTNLKTNFSKLLSLRTDCVLTWHTHIISYAQDSNQGTKANSYYINVTYLTLTVSFYNYLASVCTLLVHKLQDRFYLKWFMNLLKIKYNVSTIRHSSNIMAFHIKANIRDCLEMHRANLTPANYFYKMNPKTWTVIWKQNCGEKDEKMLKLQTNFTLLFNLGTDSNLNWNTFTNKYDQISEQGTRAHSCSSQIIYLTTMGKLYMVLAAAGTVTATKLQDVNTPSWFLEFVRITYTTSFMHVSFFQWKFFCMKFNARITLHYFRDICNHSWVIWLNAMQDTFNTDTRTWQLGGSTFRELHTKTRYTQMQIQQHGNIISIQGDKTNLQLV